MTTMRLTIASLLTLSALAGACGDDDGVVLADAHDFDARVDAPPPPPMPALRATQIDRAGRPAAALALIAPFLEDTDAARTTARDAYNQAGDATTWIAAFLDEVTDNLAIWDALD